MKARGQAGGGPKSEIGGLKSGDSSPAPLAGFVFLDSPADFGDPKALVVKVPAGIRSKQKLFAVLADKLRFPGYFGWNWDALEECLWDLSWLAPLRAIAVVHQDLPFGAGGENRGIYLDVLRSAIVHWANDRSRSVQIVMPTAVQDDLSPKAAEPR